MPLDIAHDPVTIKPRTMPTGEGQAMNAPEQPLPLVRQLRQAIADSNLSLNELARRAGVSEGQLSRFLRGHRALTLPTAARLCEYFGLELAVRRQEPPATAADGPRDRNPSRSPQNAGSGAD
jgi:hypothetical protein